MILSGSWGEDFMGQSAQEESVKENLHPSPHGAHECCLSLESEISPSRWRQKFSDLKTVENEDWILARGRWGSDTPLSYCKSIRSLILWFFNSLIAMFHAHLTSPLQKNETLILFAKLTIDPTDRVLRFSCTGKCRKSGWKWNSSWIVSLLSFERRRLCCRGFWAFMYHPIQKLFEPLVQSGFQLPLRVPWRTHSSSSMP